MVYKVLLFLLLLIIAEIYRLFKEGVADHKYAYGILKILILNTMTLSILSLKSFYLGILIKIKEVIPLIIKTAAKVILTPIKTPKKTNNEI